MCKALSVRSPAREDEAEVAVHVFAAGARASENASIRRKAKRANGGGPVHTEVVRAPKREMGGLWGHVDRVLKVTRDLAARGIPVPGGDVIPLAVPAADTPMGQIYWEQYPEWCAAMESA